MFYVKSKEDKEGDKETRKEIERIFNSKFLTPYSLLPTHYSLLTTHYSLLTTPYSLLPNLKKSRQDINVGI